MSEDCIRKWLKIHPLCSNLKLCVIFCNADIAQPFKGGGTCWTEGPGTEKACRRVKFTEAGKPWGYISGGEGDALFRKGWVNCCMRLHCERFVG
jgi:hypothetical protein